jgi:hypothetical protein
LRARDYNVFYANIERDAAARTSAFAQVHAP